MTAGTPSVDDPFARARFDFRAPVPSLAELGRVHLLSIGGAGVSAVARLLLDHGVPVSGSDPLDVPVLADLAQRGATVHVGWDADQVSGADTVVMSSAVRDDNVELVAARAAGRRILHRAQGLKAALGTDAVVAVAGANGKTTTTSLLVEGLQRAGVDPTFAIGGELASTGTNARRGTSSVAVVEADESDGSFVVYRPRVAVVTSVQPDHLDFYDDVAIVRAAYAAFADTIEPTGLLVACADDPGAAALAARCRDRGLGVVTYGESDSADLRLTQIQLDGLQARAALVVGDAVYPLRLRIPGRHNLANAAAAFGAAVLGIGADPGGMLDGLAAFAGTRRRFEIKGEAGGIRVVDDYGHNVGKVTAVVPAASAYAAPGRLVVVFQPHLYSRTQDFAEGFGVALAAADVVIVMDVYAAREDPVPGVSGELVADAVRRTGSATEVFFAPTAGDAVDTVLRVARPGDVVLTLGAGDVTKLGPTILTALEARP